MMKTTNEPVDVLCRPLIYGFHDSIFDCCTTGIGDIEFPFEVGISKGYEGNITRDELFLVLFYHFYKAKDNYKKNELRHMCSDPNVIITHLLFKLEEYRDDYINSINDFLSNNSGEDVVERYERSLLTIKNSIDETEDTKPISIPTSYGKFNL